MFGLDAAWCLPLAGLACRHRHGVCRAAHHFCTMSALERHWYASDSNGLSAWVLAAAVALVWHPGSSACRPDRRLGRASISHGPFA